MFIYLIWPYETLNITTTAEKDLSDIELSSVRPKRDRLSHNKQINI